MNKAVRACPNCGSTDIGHDSLSVVSRLSLSGARECRECGYSGIFPEMAEDEVDGFDGAGMDVTAADRGTGRRWGRAAIGALLLLLGIGASSHATWGNGLLAGLLAVAVGAAVLAEELARHGSTMEK
ncbi:MAG: hypothetical protein SVW77_03445 [Candidatus Nanohaloarchaea archaeon]|nr:hypothetical protein [Candidatus Nanohaloarchaea archaeon]